MGAISDWVEIGRMDNLGRMDTPAHRLDARVKIVVILAFIFVVMSFPRHAISALTPLAFFPASLIVLGRIPPRDIMKKIVVAAPFALVIGMFNPLIDRTPMISFGSVVISSGWISFASIMMRFVLTVSAALALVACTGMYRLCTGLEQLGVPRVFIMQLLFLYRYLFVVADEGITMLRGVQLRCPEMRHLPIRIYGSLTGHLLLRSIDRADRIHRAMVMRGFDGHIRSLRRSKIRIADLIFAAVCMALFLAARKWNLAEAMGNILVRFLS